MRGVALHCCTNVLYSALERGDTFWLNIFRPDELLEGVTTAVLSVGIMFLLLFYLYYISTACKPWSGCANNLFRSHVSGEIYIEVLM